MSDVIKQALDTNWTLLTNNIIPGQELMQQLRQHDVFPETTIQYIQRKESTEEKNGAILDSLRLRGTKYLSAFCDALQTSGHNFLADVLREQISSSPSPLVGTSEIVRQFPALKTALIQREREQLSSFLEKKIKEGIIRQMWQRDYKEKENVMDARRRQIDKCMSFARVIREKEALIQQLEEGMQLAVQDAKESGVQLSAFNRYLDQVKSHHKRDMEKQMNYNMANDRSLRRLADRQFETEKALEKMNLLMQPYVPEVTRSPSPTSPAGNPSPEPFDIEFTALSRTQAAVEILVERVKGLHELEEKHEMMMGDRQVILSMIDADLDSNCKQAVMAYISKQATTFRKLNQQIEEMEQESLRQKETTVHTAEELEEEIAQLKEDLVNKQGKIYKLSEENRRLLKSVTALRQRDYIRKRHSISKPLTLQCQDYDEENAVCSDPEVPLRPSSSRRGSGNLPGIRYAESSPPDSPKTSRGLQHPVGYHSAMNVSKISANPMQLVARLKVRGDVDRRGSH